MFPFTVNAAPIQYDTSQGAPGYASYNQQYSAAGMAQQVPPYGMVSYPSADVGYNASYQQMGYQQPQQQQQQQQQGSAYSNLDAAVYSAATAMLAERGITNSTPKYQQQRSTSSANNVAVASSGTAWKDRIEQMNPTVAATSTPSSRGGSGGRGGRGAGRGGRGGGGGRGGSQYGRYGNDKPKDPANQAMHYCEVCKVSCAGAVSFQAHVIGQKHKKREIQAKAEQAAAASGIPTAAPGVPPARQNHHPAAGRAQFPCELCGISTAGQAAYEAHLKGKAHQRTLKLHMRLGKPIPVNEPTITQKTVESVYPGAPSLVRAQSTGSSICTKVVTGGKTVLITPKMNFVGGTVLTTTGTGMQEIAAAIPDDNLLPPGITTPMPQAPVLPAAPPKPQQSRPPPRQPNTVNPNATGEAIGESYVVKTEKEGKVAYYKCTLCDCEFSDESGMNSHIRGRRHRLAYQKKVDPTIRVELSGSAMKMKQREQARRNERGPTGPMRGAKRPGPGGPPSKRQNRGPPPALHWGQSEPNNHRAPLLHEPRNGGGHPYPPRGLLQNPYDHYDAYGPPPNRYQGPPYGRPAPALLPPPQTYYPPRENIPPQHHATPSFVGSPVMDSQQRTPLLQQPSLPFDQDEQFEEQRAEPPRAAPVPPVARLDQQYLLHKHAQITPDGPSLDTLNLTVTEVERALKIVAEKLLLPDTAVQDPAVPATPQQRMLKGSYRFGRMTKNLLTKDNLIGEILLICNKHPSADNLNTVAECLKVELKAVSLQEYCVMVHNDQCGIFVKPVEPERALTDDNEPPVNYPVWVFLAYGNLRDELFKQQNAEKTAAASDDVKGAIGGGGGGGGSISTGTNVGAVSANTTINRGVIMTNPVHNGTIQAAAATISTAHLNTDGQQHLQQLTHVSGGGSSSAATVPGSVGNPPTADTGLTAAAGAANLAVAQKQTSAVDAAQLATTTTADTSLVGGLDLKRSLAVLAQSRRTRWFQEFITFFPNCRMLMRILNHVCEYREGMQGLAGWPIEFLTITVLRLQATYHGITPFDIPLAEAFWMIMSTVSSGVFLPGCPNGFKDPCERGNIDILGDLSVEERVRITRAVGDLLAHWLTGDYARVLDVEALPNDPFYKAPASQDETMPEQSTGLVTAPVSNIKLESDNVLA